MGGFVGWALIYAPGTMLVHWDDVPVLELGRGEPRQLRGRRRRLAAAAGAPRLGLSRYELGPGERGMPVHAHADEEELFFVLAGSGTALLGEAAYEVGAGDAILHPAGGPPHALVAGPQGIDVLAFGSGSDTSLTWLPRPNVMWAAPRWIPLDGPNPFAAEEACGPLELPAPSDERPREIAALDATPARERRHGDIAAVVRRLGAATGAQRSGLSHVTVDPGRLSSPPHCHSAEEELFVVLAGDGALELLHPDGTAESHPVHAGHVVSRPAGTGVAHTFGAGDDGLTLLCHSDLQDADMCFYPRSGKVLLCGLNVVMRVQRVDFWDGEG
ncbi:MAG TPA: cupin domain-containing protein [Solirubrobacteraceae bacterium]|nr:cupin domain-containing protein [Solirubrobacteraceae bacterium]